MRQGWAKEGRETTRAGSLQGEDPLTEGPKNTKQLDDLTILGLLGGRGCQTRRVGSTAQAEGKEDTEGRMGCPYALVCLGQSWPVLVAME